MKYSCPMHPEVTLDQSGYCYKCGMELVSSKGEKSEKSLISQYKPLIVIVSLILLVSALISDNTYDLMRAFMAGFFIVFSGFKLLDLKGFADGYATYDLLARKWHGYGFIYPFIELALGVMLIVNISPIYTNVAIIALMGFSGLGVLEAISKKRKFKCACLGTAIELPLTTVTLIEDFGMVIMSIIMISFL